MIVINNDTIRALNVLGSLINDDNVMVLLSKEEYQNYLNWQETKEIEANPGLNAHILKAMNNQDSDWVSMNEVNWDEI